MKLPPYSTNCMDLSLEIGMTIQLIQAGDIDTDNMIEHLEQIKTAVNKIGERLYQQ
jgi:predicted transcriptional regulator